MPESSLSIALSQHSLGLAVFKGQQLLFLEAHWLNGLPKAAEASAGFVLRCIDTFHPASAVIQERSDESPDTRAAVLDALRASNRPLTEISEQELLASFGDPPLESKDELRQLMRVLFPQVPQTRLVLSCLEAVAAGLYIETKRLLSY